MRILLDESLPRRLKSCFKGHVVKTVPDVGWQGKKNGELLKLMENDFDIFITADQNLRYQLNLRNTSIAIIILASNSNRYEDLQKLLPKIEKHLKSKKLSGVKKIT